MSRKRLGASILIVGALLGAGCKKECTAQRWGGCQGTSGGEHCGAVLQCGEDKLDLSCDTGPAKGTGVMKAPLSCRCLENGVEKKTVTLNELVSDSQAEAVKTARTACGWENR